MRISLRLLRGLFSSFIVVLEKNDALDGGRDCEVRHVARCDGAGNKGASRLSQAQPVLRPFNDNERVRLRAEPDGAALEPPNAFFGTLMLALALRSLLRKIR